MVFGVIIEDLPLIKMHMSLDYLLIKVPLRAMASQVLLLHRSLTVLCLPDLIKISQIIVPYFAFWLISLIKIKSFDITIT